MSGYQAQWPVCPSCDARRVVRCPICHTTGTDFPQADRDFQGSFEVEESTACQCGSHRCSTPAGGASGAPAPPDSPGPAPADEEPAPPMLVCPTCDEPFVPQYPGRCEWCGHQFEDGYEVDEGARPAVEPMGGRVILVMIALAVLAMGVLVYFVALV